jgi:hypothetical protein
MIQINSMNDSYIGEVCIQSRCDIHVTHCNKESPLLLKQDEIPSSQVQTTQLCNFNWTICDSFWYLGIQLKELSEVQVCPHVLTID